MKRKNIIRHALLVITGAAALISTIANGMPAGAAGYSNLDSSVALPAAKAPGEEMVTRLIVKHRARRSDKLAADLQAFDAAGLGNSADVEMTIARTMSGGAHVVKLDRPVTLSDAQAIAARLARDGSIETAEPDRLMHIAALAPPADPGYADQWHYFKADNINKGGANLPGAWSNNGVDRIGSANIIVAVLDTGYIQHADLGTVLPGYDFITNSTTANDGDGGRDVDARDPGDWAAQNECGSATPATDSSWHGTHVAGTIAALMSNGLHGTGIAPKTEILPVRVLGKCGGFTSDIVDAMRWAAGIAVPGVATNPKVAHVLNMSLSGPGACSAAFQGAVNDVVGAGKVIVAAAGNNGAAALSQPANCAGVIAVTAHAIDGDNTRYANIGIQTAISAPGGGCGFLSAGCTAFASPNGLGIYSLSNTGTKSPVADSYSRKQGTSMAVPHVSGVVALMLALDTTLTPAQIKSYLQSSARAHPDGSTCRQSRYMGLCGAGLLDAHAALDKAAGLAPVVNIISSYQVVTPNAVVPLASSVIPGAAGRSISSHDWVQQAGPAGGTIDGANTANATFTTSTPGIYTFTHTVTDDAGMTGVATATVRVNAPPVLAAIPDQSVIAGAALSFNIQASDPEGGTVTFGTESLPSEIATLDRTTGAFSWPSATPAGTYAMTYSATDEDGVSTQGTVNITVTAAASSGGGGGGGGGGSLDGELLIGLALLAAGLRIRRTYAALANA
jgi:serine protease